jgi:hypothetical protein
MVRTRLRMRFQPTNGFDPASFSNALSARCSPAIRFHRRRPVRLAADRNRRTIGREIGNAVSSRASEEGGEGTSHS